ncbi:MAG: tetratricopeptide repeat protein [Bacteroidetes bacterium]|nr:tetratricopeptide repeat protein [Bacteroidota bacterium]
MNRNQNILIVLVLLFSAGIIRAETPEDIFNRGNEMYRAGKYQESVKEYERILNEGYTSAELYYNLGNAYYRNRQPARAILSYERAARLEPNDPDINHNLRLVYLKTVDRIEPVPEMFFIQWMRAAGSLISPSTIKFLFILSWILLFGSLVVIYFVLQPDIMRISRIVFFVSFVSVFIWAIMLGIQTFQETTKDKAVITAQVVTAKSSPDVNSLDAFVIHEGIKVKLDDSVANWVKITLADGKVGWIPADQCERI